MEFVEPIYDQKDIPRMRKVIKKQVNGERNLLLFELGLATALRPSDLLDLRVEDVKTGIIRGRTNKKNKSFDFRLNDRVFGLVKSFIETMDDNELLFPMHRTTAYRFLKKAAIDCGLEENIGAHSLRKTKAYHLYTDPTPGSESKNNINLIMDLLQHDEAGSTMRYIGYRKEKLNEMLLAHDL
ncbi:tyrosine-type recombinase/integrase [Microbacterium sp. APC 3898]|uniref:Tyrosine-type recombinase/integrase n=1 Tax=Planococcus notacanthi TaxID=3035188 RepID=A0ABT7ZQQ5_9BACL|nr:MULTISPECIES: tyrosine-type recombinase/integrase [Terrabacteria group]MDN3429162.1 tyrosine-type recombinase/integrase [Planococcus sp. APC 4016]MDN3501064.1 tyrosine-type recombinase/integrase [Microbacterium sp. APC 3898]